MHTTAPVSSDEIEATRVRSFAILSTFPPTSWGIATLSDALAPSASQDQVTSGVSVVARCNPIRSGRTIRSVLTQPGLAALMGAEARRLPPGRAWQAVPRRYTEPADVVVASRRPRAS